VLSDSTLEDSSKQKTLVGFMILLGNKVILLS
jgi:hypothetical protein